MKINLFLFHFSLIQISKQQRPILNSPLISISNSTQTDEIHNQSLDDSNSTQHHSFNINHNNISDLNKLNSNSNLTLNPLTDTNFTLLSNSDTLDHSQNQSNTLDQHDISNHHIDVINPTLVSNSTSSDQNTSQPINGTHSILTSNTFDSLSSNQTNPHSNLTHSDQLNSTFISSNPFKYQPTNQSNNHHQLDGINSTLVSNSFKYLSSDKNNSNLDHSLDEINSTLTSTPFLYNSSNKTNNYTHHHIIDDINSTLTSNPFLYNSSNKVNSNLDHSLDEINSTLTSTPFFYNSSDKTNNYTHHHIIDNINSTLTSNPFLYNSSNKVNSNLDHSLDEINSTLTSTPFLYNSSDKIKNNYTHHIDKINSTLISNPFLYNSSDKIINNYTHYLDDINSTLTSTPFLYNSSNKVNNYTHQIDTSLISNPFLYNSTNQNNDQINSTLVSTPFLYNSSNKYNHTDQINTSLTSNPFLYNSSKISIDSLNSSSTIHHLNDTILSNSLNLNSSTTLLNSLHENLNSSTVVLPSNLTNTSIVRTSNIFLLPSTNSTLNSLNQTTLNKNSNSTLSTSLISSNTTNNFNLTNLNDSTLLPTPNHHNESHSAPTFVPTGSLFTNPRPTDTQGQSKPNHPIETSLPSTQAPPNKASPAPFPSSWPRYIVPSNTPASPPANSTLVSILFNDALNWPWMVTNSNASSQVLVFMPTLIANSLKISEDQVVTQSLQAYQPANFNSNDEASMLTLWLGYIPSHYVSELQAMIRASQSRFYNNPNGILRTLAQTVDPTLPITTYEKKPPASQAGVYAANSEDENSPAVNSSQKIAVIASVTTCGAAILAIGLVIAARQSRRKMTKGNRRGLSENNHSGGMLRIGAPMIGSFHRSSSGAPAPIYRPPMDPVSAVPFNGSNHNLNENLESFLSHNQNRSQVTYEYGEARTTSMIHDPFQTSNDQRKSWWNRLSFGVNRNDANGYGPINRENNPNLNLESPTDLNQPRHSTSPTINNQQISPPRSNRRLPITRGADGLVSGIGRPVMKENSLFF